SSWLTSLEKKTLVDKILSAQRLFALIIIRGYRTISREAALVLANIEPLDLKIKLIAERYQLKHDRLAAQYQRPISYIENDHPALQTDFTVQTCSTYHEYDIFTDGSKIENRTGCAFVAYQKDQIVHEEM